MASVDAAQWPFLVVLGDAKDRERMYGLGCLAADGTVLTASASSGRRSPCVSSGEPLSSVTFETVALARRGR